MSVGVFLTRGQPFHSGHASVIAQSLLENDKTLVIIGSADKCSTKRNPYDLGTRYGWFVSLCRYYGFSLVDIESDTGTKGVDCMALCDLSGDEGIPNEKSPLSLDKVNKNWGSYLYDAICSKIGCFDFTFYTGDADVARYWFNTGCMQERVSIRQVKRNGVSSSGIRELLLSGRFDDVKQFVPYLDMVGIGYMSSVLTKIGG